MKKACIFLVYILHITLLFGQKDFSFVYLPDLHLNSEPGVISNFEKLATRINSLNPDFILTGGDMIYTAKSVNDRKAEVLFNLMDKELKLFKSPVYLTMGNHEVVGITEESGIDKSNPMWGKKMYEKRYNKRYYTFMHSQWKFFVLDGIKILEKEKDYTQGIDSEQMDWIKEELKKTGKGIPIIISIHTPLINPHAMTDPDSKALSKNSDEVLKLFKDHNLKIVLQGHTHTYMNLFIEGIHYLSGGSAAYNTDPDPFNKGFAIIKIKGNTETIDFIK